MECKRVRIDLAWCEKLRNFTSMRCPILSPTCNQTPFAFAKGVKAGFWHLKTGLLVLLFGHLKILTGCPCRITAYYSLVNVFLCMLMSPDVGRNSL